MSETPTTARAASDGAEAVVAAAVSYRPVPAPDEIAAAYGDSGSAVLETFELTSLDGQTGLAVHLDARAAGANTIVISIHGSGGSVLSEPVRKLTVGLASSGKASTLSVNTRGTGAAVNAENLYATTRDVEAATWMARALGYERVVLHGHSLGSLQVAIFAATHWRDDVAGIVLTGVFADLPWKSRYMLIGDEEIYATLLDESLAAVKERDFNRRLNQEMGWLQGKTMPVSADHFLTYRAEDLAGARTIDWINKIPYPFLLIRDEHDSIIHDFERVWLDAAAAGGISPDPTFVLLPSDGGEGHHYVGSGPALLSTVTEWIAALDAAAVN